MNQPARWKVILLLAAIFAAGAITGWAVSYGLGPRFFHGPPKPAEMQARARERYRRELKLSPEQLEKITPFIQQCGAEIEATRQEMMAKIGQSLANSEARIAGELTPEQQEKLKTLATQRKLHPHHGPHPGPPPPR
jgi:hypothetical protein